VPEHLAGAIALVTELVAERAECWDRNGLLPEELLRKLSAGGVLCAEVDRMYGGLGLSGQYNGELTAHVGSVCSSVRSVMTSQGMAAWTVHRLGGGEQQARYLPRLAGGDLAAVAFSEPHAGSDLSAMSTQIWDEGDSIVIDGQKVWVTGAYYADLIIVIGRHRDGAAAVIVPATTPGVTVERIVDPVGCRAAGHADVHLDSVRLPADSVLGAAGQSLSLLVTSVLAYGRVSVAWGCVGILRACLTAATRHAQAREQFGKPLIEHQLVSRHIAELFISEQVSTRVCEHASRCWDSATPEMVMAAVLAKHVCAGHAVRGAASAVQILASAGAYDGHVVARAYRDAKLMEIIEGSNELCQLMLAQHAVAVSP
jgi:alkylation response protein AidB-like acyl-CoA dehydrogenase